ncbi:MAG: hypothetical protein DI582_11085 [Azospirillum brasilense]|nr:MAG: hypothetical protein DI582_11085 [Azospirillum brasilense]
MAKDFWDMTSEEQQQHEHDCAVETLAQHLAAPRWHASDAAYILAGIDPELYVQEPSLHAWLLHSKPKGVVTGDELKEHIANILKEVRGFIHGKTRTPHAWLAECAALGYAPPWLARAYDYPALIPYLPTNAHKSTPGTFEQSIISQHARNVQKQYHENSAAGKTWSAIQSDFLEYLPTCQLNAKGRLNKTDRKNFIEKMQKQHGIKPDTLERKIFNWYNEMNAAE